MNELKERKFLNERIARALAVALILALAFSLKGLMLVPPGPSADAEFDAARAISRLERILGDQRPHPVDTPANDAVRGRIVTELRALGLEAAIRERPDCSGLPGSHMISCSLTRNVVAVIGADKPGKALLLNAHYDSTPAGPGAADDGIGVATLLEVAANLRQRPLPHPVILLFNEGEEFGLNGASAFVEGDPLAARIGSLINVEARGVSGPAWMFETDEPNGAAIAAFAAASRRPYANSLTADFAKLIPNYTDVVIFKQAARWRTLNFAVVGNETRYHSPGDDIASLSRSSVQHLGSEVLAASRTIASERPAGRTVYADVAGRFLLALPFVVAAIALAALIIANAALAWRRRAYGRPLAAVAAATLAGIAAASIASWFGGLLRAGDFWRAYPLVTYLAVYATTIAIQWGVLGWLGGVVDRSRLRPAAWLLVLVAGGALSLFVPGAMIFFLAAPAIALIGMQVNRPVRRVLLWGAAILHLVMFAELAASVEVLLVDGPLWAVAPIAALAALPLLVEAAQFRARFAAGAIALLAALLWIAALSLPRASAERPLAFTIDHVRDEAKQAAWWAIASKQAPLSDGFDRAGRWERKILPDSGRTRWVTEAPAIGVPRASVTKIGETPLGTGRLVRLRLSTGGADKVSIRLDPETSVAGMGLPGSVRRLARGAEPQPAILRCSGRACDGMVVDIALLWGEPVEALVIAQRFALPPQGAALARLRPHDAQPQYGPDSSLRISGTRF